MNFKATVRVERDPVDVNVGPWPKTCHVLFELELIEAKHGDGAAGAVERAFDGARRIVSESLRASA